MKGRLVAFVGIFCIASLIVAGQDAQGKPDKPVQPNTEWIAFDGDLVAGQAVVGCCPNAGPFPEYRMCLNFWVGSNPPGWYDGQLFINYYGAGRNRKYKVQFWNDALPGLAIEIIGGVIDYDKKNGVLTVTFIDELCVNLWTQAPIAHVNFALKRYAL